VRRAVLLKNEGEEEDSQIAGSILYADRRILLVTGATTKAKSKVQEHLCTNRKERRAIFNCNNPPTLSWFLTIPSYLLK
jgi:hypothetical protein